MWLTVREKRKEPRAPSTRVTLVRAYFCDSVLVDDNDRCTDTSYMQTLHSTLTQTIALFSSAAPIVFALVSMLAVVLNLILRLDRRRTLPLLDDGRAKLLRTLLSYLANSDLEVGRSSHRRDMRPEQSRR
jgi:hypothetical protein